MRGAQTRIMRGANFDAESGEAHEILVTIYGSRIGYKIDLDPTRPSTVIGRDLDADIPVDDESVSRRHCRLMYLDGAWFIEDLRSTNGTYVAGSPITRTPLRDGDLIKIGSTIFKFLSTSNVEAAYYEEIYRMAIFDGLTQIHNRRYFEEFTDREISRCRRHERALSLLLFDVDKFKQINDRFGHLSGDYVLRTMAGIIARRIRREELFARYAGDEFVIVLPETDIDDAQRFAEVVRRMVDEHDFRFDGRALPVTISVGVGTFAAEMSTPAHLVAAADAALYRAKEQGRNRVAT
ncbi:MAG: GGDEF domain-containing protein [Myxococcales bacterium]|nr:GGDEF domain-containing protein [Myxococcales bacterium]MCB9550492.1 GGDEF domain-containing protein [Myxococcales bacterium]